MLLNLLAIIGVIVFIMVFGELLLLGLGLVSFIAFSWFLLWSVARMISWFN